MKKIFSEKPQSLFSLFSQFLQFFMPIVNKRRQFDFGSLDTPTLIISKVFQFLTIPFNINHLGNWSGKKDKPWATQRLETKLLEMLCDLYRTNIREVGGYVTSGGSEANLFLAWMGRSYLQKKGSKRIVHLYTSLTHYSVVKAATITNLELVLVGLDEQSWSMSVKSLKKKLDALVQEGCDGVSICLTYGYSSTGTSDDAEALLPVLDEYKKKLDIFVWIDAALYGVVYPFSIKQFKPFSHNFVQGFVVDFSKFGLTAPSAGAVLYRQNLRQLVESGVAYLTTSDATLLGGRSGVPVITTWAALSYLGKQGLRKKVCLCLDNKKYLMQKLSEKQVKYVTDAFGITLGIRVKKRLKPAMEKFFSLYQSELQILFDSGKTKKVFMYKLFMLPHLSKKAIDLFIDSLSE